VGPGTAGAVAVLHTATLHKPYVGSCGKRQSVNVAWLPVSAGQAASDAQRRREARYRIVASAVS
jgi:hypothetical protein